MASSSDLSDLLYPMKTKNYHTVKLKRLKVRVFRTEIKILIYCSSSLSNIFTAVNQSIHLPLYLSVRALLNLQPSHIWTLSVKNSQILI